MPAVIFDFDSTLIPGESLELALARAPGVGADELRRIEAITRRGMEGEIGFAESLEARLGIARPTRESLNELGTELARGLTGGAADLVDRLHAAEMEVWIVSGAFRDVLLPPGRALGIPDDRIHGVRARWDDGGAFVGLVPEDGFSCSKVVGARWLRPGWSRPAVGVGDGATDYALFAAGLVDAFVPYTEHARRQSVLAHGLPAAADMTELGKLLETLLP